MAGAARRRKAEAEQRRDLALMTAYFAGNLSGADWRKVPPFQAWLAQMTRPPRAASNAELISQFDAWASSGLAVTRLN